MTDHRIADIRFSENWVECRCGEVIRGENLADAYNTHRASLGLKKGERLQAGDVAYENTPWRARGAMAIRRMGV